MIGTTISNNIFPAFAPLCNAKLFMRNTTCDSFRTPTKISLLLYANVLIYSSYMPVYNPRSIKITFCLSIFSVDHLARLSSICQRFYRYSFRDSFNKKKKHEIFAFDKRRFSIDARKKSLLILSDQRRRKRRIETLFRNVILIANSTD